MNTVRALAKSYGLKPRKCNTTSFANMVRAELPEELLEMFGPLLDSLDHLNITIAGCDELIEELSREVYPETEVVRQVKGVGPVTGLAFVLTIDDPERFERSRDVPAYLGLVPKRDQSGDTDRQLGIHKQGDAFLRRHLVQSAQYIIGRFGPDTTLRRWGLALAERGGRRGYRRAVVAVARKLAVLLHRLWVNGEVYEPLRGTA